MKRSIFLLTVSLVLSSFAALGADASHANEIALWPIDAVPGAEGLVGDTKEIWKERGSPQHPDRSVTNVHQPTLTIYLPPREIATGSAVVICPGGGYGGLAIDKEGHDVARWLNTLGVAGLVLKYRLPRPPNGHVYGHAAPLADAQRAMGLTRARAAEFNIRPDRVGVMGFSAGGHLASTASTHFSSGAPGAPHPADRQSNRPDFTILVYPVVSFDPSVYHSGSCRNLLGEDPPQELVDLYSNEKQVTADTPPAFLVHTLDDGVNCQNSVLYAMALKKVKVPAEMHLYATGGHGYGLRKVDHNVATWPLRCAEWLESMSLAKAP